jgi:two-component system LytT family response regulator
MRSPQAPRKLALHTAEKISVVSIDDILYCEAERNYTTFHLQDGARLVVSRTLKEYEQMLQEYGFLRAHQSFLVNLAHVRAYDKKDGGYLNMAGGNLVPVSYRRRPQVLKAIEHL